MFRFQTENCQPRILYPVKIDLKDQSVMMAFVDIAKQKELTSRTTQQELLKAATGTEGK